MHRTRAATRVNVDVRSPTRPAGDLVVRKPPGWAPWHFTSEMHAKMKCRLWQGCMSRPLTKPIAAGAVGARLTNFANASGARHLQLRTEAGFALSSKMTPASWWVLRRARYTMVAYRDSWAS